MTSKAKLAGHAVHPMLITLPLGLLDTAVIFDIIRAFTDEADLAVASFYLLACRRQQSAPGLCWVSHSAGWVTLPSRARRVSMVGCRRTVMWSPRVWMVRCP